MGAGNSLGYGARVAGVDEPPWVGSQALIEIEFDEIAEPKALLPVYRDQEASANLFVLSIRAIWIVTDNKTFNKVLGS
jgi:hypothetical protein